MNLTRPAVVLTALLAALPTGSVAAPGSEWDARRAEAFGKVARTRELVSTGRLADAVRAAADLQSIDLGDEQPEALPAPAGLPAAIAPTIGRVAAAVERAEELAQASILIRPRSDEAAFRDVFTLLDARRSEAEQRRVAARLRRAVDPRPVLRGASMLAREIDRAMPVLQAYAATRPRGETAVGCDQLDTPAVCIGGTGSNTFTEDVALLIDLGGDDTYRNSAGGADLGGLGGGNGLAVSVNIDVAGNDLYDATLPTASGSGVAQGSGWIGGIGILVDAAGNDRYAATHPAGSKGGLAGTAQAFAEYGSVGILADAAGNDSYRLSSYEGFYGAPPSAIGQAISGVGSAALMLDGGGNDSYLAEHRPVPREDGDSIQLGAPVALALTASAEGPAILFDAGGTDSLEVVAATAAVDPDDPRAVEPGSGAIGEGFGFAGLGGNSIAITGSGPTRWTVRAETEAPTAESATVWAFGATTVGALGAVSDAGGDDVYLGRATSRATVRRSVGDGCECPGVEAVTGSGFAQVNGAANGSGGAVAVLEDLGGNDRYVGEAVSAATAEAHDGRTRIDPDSETAGATARAETGGARAAFLGYGVLGGAGFVADASGNDVYETITMAEARADATAALDDAPREATATAYGAATEGQAVGLAGGYGELRDTGGTDSYRTTNAAAAHALPLVSDGSNAQVLQGAQAYVQAASLLGAAFLLDLDGGLADSFSQIPAYAACAGARGQDMWVDCGTAGVAVGSAVGVNR